MKKDKEKRAKELKKLVDEGCNMLIDESVLTPMFKGTNVKGTRAKDLMDKMKKINDMGGREKLRVLTPMSHFLRALFLADPETPIKNIQKVLSFATILPSFADFKDKEACMQEMVLMAQTIQENGY